MTDRSLSTALSYIANDLDRRYYPYSGVVRRAARVLAELEPESHASVRFPCPFCGDPVARKRSRGRVPTYCSPRCRRATERAREKSGRNGSLSSGVQNYTRHREVG